MGMLLRASGPPLLLPTLMLMLILLMMMLRLMLLPPLARLPPMMLPLAKLTLMLHVAETFAGLEKREETVPWPLPVPPPRSTLR
jgi:hypothetical protein